MPEIDIAKYCNGLREELGRKYQEQLKQIDDLELSLTGSRPNTNSTNNVVWQSSKNASSNVDKVRKELSGDTYRTINELVAATRLTAAEIRHALATKSLKSILDKPHKENGNPKAYRLKPTATHQAVARSVFGGTRELILEFLRSRSSPATATEIGDYLESKIQDRDNCRPTIFAALHNLKKKSLVHYDEAEKKYSLRRG